MENSDEGQGVFSLGYRWSMLTKQRLGGFQRLGNKKKHVGSRFWLLVPAFRGFGRLPILSCSGHYNSVDSGIGIYDGYVTPCGPNDPYK